MVSPVYQKTVKDMLSWTDFINIFIMYYVKLVLITSVNRELIFFLKIVYS